MAAPDFLAIGHVSRDVTPEGHALGGAVVFGAVTAARMGLRPAIVTSAAPGFDPGPALAGIPVHVVPAGATTSFENVDAGGGRTQYVHSVAGPIGRPDVPEDWAGRADGPARAPGARARRRRASLPRRDGRGGAAGLAAPVGRYGARKAAAVGRG